MTAVTFSREDVREGLKSVYDPEIGINIVDLGLVYDCDIAESGDVLSYLAPGYRRRWLRRLIRGQFVIADQIDLHHLDLKRAGRVLSEFLKASRASDRLCLRIIHGKGGARGSVLKAMVERDLTRRIEVIAFHSAPRDQGGTGAVDVLLRAQH